jgi:hypothetical protein
MAMKRPRGENAMEGASQPDNSARPRRKRRWLILLLLLVVGVGSYWIVPWLLMPGDLRRMQGVWKVVKLADGDKETPANPGQDRLHVVGSRFFAKADEEWYQARVAPEEKRMYFYHGSSHEYELFGIKIRLPFMVTRPTECVCLEYQLTDRQLVLSVKGMMDVATGQVTDRPDEPHRIYLERP